MHIVIPARHRHRHRHRRHFRHVCTYVLHTVGSIYTHTNIDKYRNIYTHMYIIIPARHCHRHRHRRRRHRHLHHRQKTSTYQPCMHAQRFCECILKQLHSSFCRAYFQNSFCVCVDLL